MDCENIINIFLFCIFLWGFLPHFLGAKFCVFFLNWGPILEMLDDLEIFVTMQAIWADSFGEGTSQTLE